MWTLTLNTGWQLGALLCDRSQSQRGNCTVAQWQSACLAWVRPRVRSPAPREITTGKVWGLQCGEVSRAYSTLSSGHTSKCSVCAPACLVGGWLPLLAFEILSLTPPSWREIGKLGAVQWFPAAQWVSVSGCHGVSSDETDSGSVLCCVDGENLTGFPFWLWDGLCVCHCLVSFLP